MVIFEEQPSTGYVWKYVMADPAGGTQAAQQRFRARAKEGATRFGCGARPRCSFSKRRRLGKTEVLFGLYPPELECVEEVGFEIDIMPGE